jgi:hypothetical protein
MTGDFTSEKEYVMCEMQQHLQALKANEMLTPPLKEASVKIVVVPIFRYSAGVVPWSKTELDQISTLWMAAYKPENAWNLPCSMDSTPIILDQEHGGRACPSATEVWIRAGLDALDQCISLPGEISRIVTAHLQNTCLDHGCYALNQLQRLLCISDSADTTLEGLLLRLD